MARDPVGDALPFGVRFRIGDAFPGEDPVARFVVVLLMALNDLLPQSERLTQAGDAGLAPHERLYLARLVGSHLFELAKFVNAAPRQFRDRRVPRELAGGGAAASP